MKPTAKIDVVGRGVRHDRQCASRRGGPRCSATLLGVSLAGTVSATFEVSMPATGSAVTTVIAFVEFPDDFRSFLFALPWRRDARIVDYVAQIGAALVLVSMRDGGKAGVWKFGAGEIRLRASFAEIRRIYRELFEQDRD